MLIIFGGLPGTGKTSIAKRLARRLQAVYLRIDSIEQTIRRDDPALKEIGPVGYYVAYALAADNLSLGLTVIADSVNSLAITRQAWREVARKTQQAFVEIELICSDEWIHQTRVKKRVSDIPGHKLPDWQAVVHREYEPWLGRHLVIDTSTMEIENAVENILQHVQMNSKKKLTEKLFSYGTLQQEEVQHATFGHKLIGVPDHLVGYQLSMVKITDPHVLVTSGKEFHPILIYTGKKEDRVAGVVFEITPEELLQADRYEVADYKRVEARFLSGTTAWVYVKKD